MTKYLRTSLTLTALLTAVLVTVPAAVLTGAENFSLNELFQALLSPDMENMTHIIIRELRLPRVIMAVLTGAALGISGTILQSVLRNVLVSPDLLGISAGGGCAGLIVMLYLPQFAIFCGAAVFAGAMVVAMLIYLAAWRRQIEPVRMLLAGVAISALFGTAATAMLMLTPERYSGVYNFLIGGFNGKSWYDLKFFVPGFAIAFFSAALLPEKLDVLLLGDNAAAALGLPVERTRCAALATAALAAASAAGTAGLLSFAGLLAPHIVRFAGKSGSHRFLLTGSALAGAELVLLGDWLGRTVVREPAELPAGIFLAGCGAIFFLLLLLLHKREAI